MKRTATPYKTLLGVFLILLLAVPAVAQFRAGIQGTITDPSGAVVPGVKVTATNSQTGIAKSSVATASGFYRIDFLPPGTYTVRFEGAGFQPIVHNGVAVGGDSFTSIDASLKPKANEQTVEVSAEVNGVQTENANVSQAITSSQIANLPAFGRDPYELVRLAPGVFGDQSRGASGNAISLPNATGPGGSSSSIFQTENQVQVSGNGQRTSANSFEIDGVNVNSLNWGGAAVVTPNMESVKEMNVVSSTYSAEDGRNTGVQVKVVSQTGTNKFHGSALFKYDDPNFNADPRWGGPGGAKSHPVTNNYRDWAASIGGPIKKDKLFFFLSYEGQHQTATNYTTGYYITPQYLNLVKGLRAGTPVGTIFAMNGLAANVIQDLSASKGCADFGGTVSTNSSNCQILANGLDIGSPTGAYGSYVPIGSTGGGFDGVPDIGYGQFALPNRSNGNQFNGRLDYNMGNTQFAASSYITKLSSVSSDGSSNGMSQADVNLKPLNMLFTLLGNTTITPTLLNEARFNISRFAFNQVSSNPQADWGIPHLQVEGLPIPRFQMAAPWANTTPGVFAQNQYEFRDIVSKVIGKQGFKFGFEYRDEQNNNNELGGARPFYSFSGLWNLANGTPIFEQLDASPANGGPASAQVYLRTHNIALFAQDDWKVRRNLTVNLGLRWEYFSPLSEKNSALYNISIPNDGTGLAKASMKKVDSIYPTDHNNFGPRIGFAWSPDHFKDKMVVRGGFGVGFNRLPSAIYGNMARNPPGFAFFGLCCGTSAAEWSTPFANGQIQFYLGGSNAPNSYPANTAIGQGINANGFPNVGAVEVYSAAPNTATPYVYNYSLDTEYQLPAHFVGSIGYEGSSSHKLLRLIPGHIVIPQNAAQQNPSISALYMALTDVTANYNSLNLNVRRAFSSGIQFTMKYRWSKAMDELSNEGPGFSTNQTWPQDQSLEYGPSDYDVTHYLMSSILYRLPFFKNSSGLVGNVLGGWEISGIFTYHSGFPWTPVSYFNCYQLPSTQTLCPVRPVAYYGGAGKSQDTGTFISGGNFPLNLTGNPANPSAYFDVTHSGAPGVGRNSFRGPRYTDLDMTLGKSFKLPWRESTLLDLRGNFFNVTNHLNLAPFGFASSSTNIGDSNFGKASAPLAGRVIELQARFTF